MVESANPVELGTLLAISINTTDLAGIQEVVIEYENSNHTMINIGGNIWNFDSWMPNSIGNCTYKIYITDNSDNLNYLDSWILFIDTIIPNFDNLFESANPLELGDTQIIRINAYDFAGINQCLIEYEGANHSMINIYGNTWQFDSWSPNNWTIYQYRIYVEDNSGNWNLVLDNFTVQDTTPPSPPILTNSPSGDVRGNLVFDWSDGIDPSGIVYYILIIDNETDPLSTPGYINLFNISNTGTESSYYELSENLPVGKYYYFLAQVDGAGHQSSYTMGTFTVILNPDNPDFFLIIMLIIIGAVASIAVIGIIVRKKTQKETNPPRKKIPYKTIIQHLNKISPQMSDTIAKDAQEIPIIKETSPESLIEEIDIEEQVKSFKDLAEEFFSNGAYLEAIEQFQNAKNLLLKHGKDTDVTLISDLIEGIERLVEERESRLNLLRKEKTEGNTVKIFNLYQEVIEISNKLRDFDIITMYQSELTEYFKNNLSKIPEIESYRNDLEKEAELFISTRDFNQAAQLFEKCEEISQILEKYTKEERTNVEKFRFKKNVLNKRTNQNHKGDIE